MDKKDISLKSLIYKSQRKTTLIPIFLLILVVFISLFFLIKNISKNHEELFLKEAETNIENITKENASFLENNFNNIAAITKLFSDIHQQIVDKPNTQNNGKIMFSKSKNGSIYKKEKGICFYYCSKKAKNLTSEVNLLKKISNIEYIYKNIVDNNDSIYMAYFGTINGSITGYPYIENIDKKLGGDLNLKGPTLFKQNKREKKIIWSGLYKDAITNDQMISCLAPIYRKNKLLGSVALDISINKLNNKLMEKWKYINTDSFILNKNGMLITVQDRINKKPKLRKLIDEIYKNNKNTINLLDLNNEQNFFKIRKLLNNQLKSCYIKVGNKNYFLAKNDINIAGWKLFTITNKENMLKTMKIQLNNIKYIYFKILLLIFFITISCVVFLFIQSKRLTHQISYPIERLEKSLEQGNLKKLKINHSEISEVNSLAISFNKLLNELELSKKDLENFNNTLQTQFEKEVEKNREQERLVFQQARLIQMGELIGNIAHQWRQPLNGVALIIQSFFLASQDNTLTESFLQEQCHNAMNMINSMSETIDNFRNFFKTEDSIEIFKINNQITESLKILKNSFEDRGISITVDFDENISIKASKQVFSQVLLNILSNAEHVLRERRIENKHILIKTYNYNSSITIEIYDSAGGVDSAIISRIFEPFFTTQKFKSNVGLGLYMSKILLNDYFDGKISVKNKNFQIKNNNFYGACFKIEIPVNKTGEIMDVNNGNTIN